MAVHFVYKCRACGAHFSKGHLPTFEEADRVFGDIRRLSTNGGACAANNLRMLGGHHDCKVLKKGLADLVGIGDDPHDMVTRPR